MKSKRISIIMLIMLLLAIAPVVKGLTGCSLNFYVDLDSFLGSNLFSIILSLLNTALIVLYIYKTGKVTLCIKKYHAISIVLAVASCAVICIIYWMSMQSDKLMASVYLTIDFVMVLPICVLFLLIINYIFAKEDIILMLFNYFWIHCFASVYDMSYLMSSIGDNIEVYSLALKAEAIPTLITGIITAAIAYIAALVYSKHVTTKQAQLTK